jgi:hypothetical protein
VSELSVDAFCAWLCEREHEVVGRAGSCFDCPVARWLSECFGGVYGVDGPVYGRPCWEVWHWRALPRWAVLFTACLERRHGALVLGSEAFVMLAAVEAMAARPWAWLVV